MQNTALYIDWYGYGPGDY